MAGSPVYYTRNLNIDESAGVITAPLSWAEQSAAFIIIIGLLWALSCLVSYKSDAFKCSCKQLYYLITPRSNVFSVIPCCWALWRSSSIALTIWTCARLLLLLHKARLLDVVTCTCTDTTLSATLIISRPLSTHYTLQVTLTSETSAKLPSASLREERVSIPCVDDAGASYCTFHLAHFSYADLRRNVFRFVRI